MCTVIWERERESNEDGCSLNGMECLGVGGGNRKKEKVRALNSIFHKRPLDFTFFTASKEAPQNTQKEWANPQLSLCLHFIAPFPVAPSSAPPPPASETLLLKAFLTSEKLDHVADVSAVSEAG